MSAKMRIDGGRAYISGTGMDKEEAVELPPDIVLENTLFYPHLVSDFARRNLEFQNYKIFNGRDAKVQDVVYTNHPQHRAYRMQYLFPIQAPF